MTLATEAQRDSVHDVLRHPRRHPLDIFFSPRTVAIIGATDKPGSVGEAIVKNLSTFDGSVYPVNPKYKRVGGMEAFPNISAIPDQVDLAVIATPADVVPRIIRECVSKQTKAAVIISSGFRECGAQGTELEKQIHKTALGKMRIIGPNCLGLMAPYAGLNATFASAMALAGGVGFISQSGALGTAILDWSLREQVGFSAFISVGSMVDVSWGDLIFYLGDDPGTKSIVIYMESVGDARSFLSAAREVALTKPIIVLKAGRTDQGSKAVVSHTGSLTGRDEVLEAAFRRVGVLRVKTIEELFDMAEVLAKQPRPKGPRLAIITNAGGPGALATDMAVSSGGKISDLSPQISNSLDEFLPPHWSHGNPIDILGDADSVRYAKTLAVLRNEQKADGVLVILTPQAMSNPSGTADALKTFADYDGKPLLACWMGGDSVEAGRNILNASGICTFDYPDTAARAYNYMWRYTYNLRGIYETPSLRPISEEQETSRNVAGKIMEGARKEERTILTEHESKKTLEAYGIPTAETHIAATKQHAIQIAEQIHYPVVVKLHSKTITHKTEVDGVWLNLRSAKDVCEAWDAIERSVRERVGHKDFLGVTVQRMITSKGYELIVGSSIDRQFGPVLLFGAGGRLVEVFQDRALALPPLNSTLALRLMEQTKIFEVLKGFRGEKAIDLTVLEQLLVRFSHLVVEQRWIREIDVNPLLASAGQLIALDARIILHEPGTHERDLPILAIRPYPAHYTTHWKAKAGRQVLIRPIRPEDEPALVSFHQTLSEQSVYNRYFMPMKLPQRIAHERLARMCFNDYDREIALVAQVKNERTNEHEIVGVGRLSKVHGVNDAEFAIVVSDAWQGQGLGTQLLRLLLRVGRDENLEHLTAQILGDNYAMQGICRKLGFNLRREEGGTEVLAQIKI